jgi:hypothetical protein
MAELLGNLWEYNLTRVVVVDVSDDYRLMQPPMPNDFYPVLREEWLPSYRLTERLSNSFLVNGYLYDWHESPGSTDEPWYVGVVDEALAKAEEELIEKARMESQRADALAPNPGAFQLELFSLSEAASHSSHR